MQKTKFFPVSDVELVEKRRSLIKSPYVSVTRPSKTPGEGVYNRLTKRIGGLRDLVVGQVAGGKGEVAALISDDRAGSPIAHCAKSARSR